MNVRTHVLIICLHCLLQYVSYAVNPAVIKDCVAYESSYHIERACECVVFESYGRNEGIFTSPDFPQIYASSINCILYTFIADLDEIVELTFLEFDLQPAVNSKCSDFLKFFVNLDRPEVNEFYSWDYELCGGISNIQKRHYSSDRSLVLEFHTDSVQQNNTGFRGRYKFLEKAELQIDGGSKVWGSECAYDFYSTESTRSGRLFSPKYPQNYPPGSSCQYVFHGRHHERVNLTFLNIQLLGNSKSCEDSPDTITVHDGRDETAPIIARFCGRHNNKQTVSSTEALFVHFVSDDSEERQGFAATFNFFIPRTGHSSSRVIATSTTSGQVVNSATNNPRSVTECVQTFSSSSQKSGTFSSPYYPQPYRAGTRCRYLFKGADEERVMISFQNLDLYYPHGDPKQPQDCNAVDSVIVYVTIKGDKMEIGIYCGSSRPPMLMSSDEHLEVDFNGDASSSATGFTATYSFVRDFGIKQGIQDDNLECGFIFRSTDSTNGTFTSPNFPGQYPRNTECHYLFYGQSNEKIVITFLYFHVEGIHPCSDETRSDYVEFSNFNIRLTDRQMERICGSNVVRDNQLTMSDGNFFRVTFKANEIYDATGFQALYQFRKDVEDKFSAGKRASVTGGSGRHYSSVWCLLSMLILLQLASKS